MRLYKVVILVNIALATGYVIGSHWWGQEVIRLNRELANAKETRATSQAGERSWSVKGIVRGISTEANLLFVTHDALPGLMSSMTMGFRANDPKLLQGLNPGDLIQFTVKESGNQLVVVAVQKDKRP